MLPEKSATYFSSIFNINLFSPFSVNYELGKTIFLNVFVTNFTKFVFEDLSRHRFWSHNQLRVMIGGFSCILVDKGRLL